MSDIVKGNCLCGEVEMEGQGKPSLAICHCDMCRHWHGGPAVSVNFSDGIKILKGDDSLTWFKSSDWAARGFCKICGSTLFYRLHGEPGMLSGEAGTFDLPEGLTPTEHYFIDQKPDYYDFADEAPRLTAEQTFAKYAEPNE